MIRTFISKHGKVLSDIGVIQECHLSPTLFGLHIDKLEMYLDEIGGDSLHLFNTAVAILVYSDDVVFSL